MRTGVLGPSNMAHEVDRIFRWACHATEMKWLVFPLFRVCGVDGAGKGPLLESDIQEYGGGRDEDCEFCGFERARKHVLSSVGRSFRSGKDDVYNAGA